jgi:HSP20 family protein
MPLPVRRRDVSPQPTEHWDPFRELEVLHERMGQLMAAPWANGGGVAWTPPVDIMEADDAWIVEAELPGVDRDDITVEVRDSELSISGEIKERERQGILRRRTRRVGEFDFHVTLPGQADAEHVEATLRDGVLTVRVPKPEQARPRRIEVKPQS